MRKVLIIGSGIAGLTCAIECAERGMKAVMVSPYPSERAQSVLAAGGINAVLDVESGDSIECHIEDTRKGGCYIAGRKAVTGLCEDAPEIIRWLEKIGTVFSTDPDGRIRQRAFGGQSYNRTCYCGSATGKQIVTALIMEARRYEGQGLIERRIGTQFYSALISNDECYGAILFNERTEDLEAVIADHVVIATGGMSALLRMSTGTTLCDGYAAGKLFEQGVELKNLEFIQYHPTTIITGQKRMLVSEAARGEGGRLYYEENGRRVYFMEEKYGERGNLMPRDIVSRCMEETHKEVFLDVSFLGKDRIIQRIPEVYELCRKYLGLDISEQSIPVVPSVHFFMGGIAVNNDHETRIRNLYAIGECASMYHGANRLGGNSLLAAIHGARIAARAMDEKASGSMDTGSAHKANGGNADIGSAHEANGGNADIGGAHETNGGNVVSVSAHETNCMSTGDDWSHELEKGRMHIRRMKQSKSTLSVMQFRYILAQIMMDDLGIVRNSSRLQNGIYDVNYYLSVIDKVHFDISEMLYNEYSLKTILNLAKATLICAESRKESRGAHIRSDYPETKDECAVSTIISYDDGEFNTYPDTEGRYEN